MNGNHDIESLIQRFIEEGGSLTQSLGMGRVVGQIYAYLYFSQQSRNLQQMQDALGISKGSASTCVRQLEQWRAVRKVWVKGDRKDYYEANEWLGQIVRSALADTMGRKMVSHSGFLEEAQSEVDAIPATSDDERVFVRERIDQLSQFSRKAQRLWNNPIVQMLFK